MARELFLFVILLLLCGLMGALFFFVEPPPMATGLQHPEFTTMQVGGDPARHDTTLMLGWLFAVLQVLFFAGLLALAIGRRLRTPDGKPNGWGALAFGTGALLAAFAAMVTTYIRFMETGADSRLFLSFPVPTAWMLYAVWTAPLIFIVLFVVKFDSWILTPEDRQRFDELVANAKSEG